MSTKESKTVLFLCAANVYRSRAAEALFNYYCKKNGLKDKAESAALVYEDEPKNPLVEKVIKEKVTKKFMPKNPPKFINQYIIDRADIIVVMNADLLSFLKQFHTKGKKIITWSIPDVVAYRYDFTKIPVFRKGISQIEGKVKELIKKLKQ